MFKKNIKKISFIFTIIVMLILIYTLVVYFSKKTFNLDIMTFIIGIICFWLLGILSSSITKKRGLITGLTISFLTVLFIFIIATSSGIDLNHKSYIKWLIYLLSGSLGGIIGINFKKND